MVIRLLFGCLIKFCSQVSKKISRIWDFPLKFVGTPGNYNFLLFFSKDFNSSAPKITPQQFEIQWKTSSALQIQNQSKALSDLSKLYSFWENTGAIVRFEEVIRVSESLESKLDKSYPNHVGGQVVSLKEKGEERRLFIKCKTGWISFRKFYYARKKMMTASDFYSGFISTKKSSVPKFISNYEVAKLP